MDPKYSLIEVLRDRWWIGALALGVSLAATPIVRAIAYRLKIVDRPDDYLKPHTRPVAYLGGIAMSVGLLAGLAGFAFTLPDLAVRWREVGVQLSAGCLGELWRNPLWKLMAVSVSCVLIMVVGLIDDIRGITPRQKVFGQVTAAMILLLGGVGVGMASMFFSSVGLHPPIWVLIPARTLILLVVVVAACNATNLLDGLDGLCGGVTGIISLGFLALAVFLASWGWQGHEVVDNLRVGLALAMAGAVLGFLPYNIPPASIFMGDAGSMLLGFFVATMMALFSHEGNARWFLAACAIFSLPILDTGLAVVRRVLSRKGIFTGDRSHLYDQLVDRGMTVKQVVVLFYVLAIVAAVVGVVLAICVPGRYALAFYGVMAVIVAVVFHKLRMVTPPPHEPKPSGAIPPQTEVTRRP